MYLFTLFSEIKICLPAFYKFAFGRVPISRLHTHRLLGNACLLPFCSTQLPFSTILFVSKHPKFVHLTKVTKVDAVLVENKPIPKYYRWMTGQWPPTVKSFASNCIWYTYWPFWTTPCHRVAVVGWLSCTAAESLRSFVERVFANFSDKKRLFSIAGKQ